METMLEFGKKNIN